MHGDVRGAYTSTGTELANYVYSSWGDVTDSSTSTWATENPVRYNGQYLDSETGMYYLRARYYDPQMGRFISEDPHWTVDNMIYGDEELIQQFIRFEKMNSKNSETLFQYNTVLHYNENMIVFNDNSTKLVDYDWHLQLYFDLIKCFNDFNRTNNKKYMFELDNNVVQTPNTSSILQSSNLYTYCANNPIMFIDEFAESITATAAAATAIYEAIPYIAAGVSIIVVGTVNLYKEHTSNKRKSTQNKHEEGQARRQKDAGNEKGDARRTPRKDKRK